MSVDGRSTTEDIGDVVEWGTCAVRDVSSILGRVWFRLAVFECVGKWEGCRTSGPPARRSLWAWVTMVTNRPPIRKYQGESLNTKRSSKYRIWLYNRFQTIAMLYCLSCIISCLLTIYFFFSFLFFLSPFFLFFFFLRIILIDFSRTVLTKIRKTKKKEKE